MIILPYVFIKLSFFLLYLQIFRPFLWLRICIIAGAVIVTAVYVAGIVAQFIVHTPRPGQTWLEYFQVSRADKISANTSWPLPAWTLASDVYVLAVPIAGVSRLQISARRRFGVTMVFMTGLGFVYQSVLRYTSWLSIPSACICSSLSLYFRVKMTQGDTSRAIIDAGVTA